MPHRPPPEECPICGEDVPRSASACPHCGADWKTGWNEDVTAADGLDLPDASFDYTDFVKREFGGKGCDQTGVRPWAKIVAVVLLAVVLLGWAVLR